MTIRCDERDSAKTIAVGDNRAFLDPRIGSFRDVVYDTLADGKLSGVSENCDKYAKSTYEFREYKTAVLLTIAILEEICQNKYTVMMRLMGLDVHFTLFDLQEMLHELTHLPTTASVLEWIRDGADSWSPSGRYRNIDDEKRLRKLKLRISRLIHDNRANPVECGKYFLWSRR